METPEVWYCEIKAGGRVVYDCALDAAALHAGMAGGNCNDFEVMNSAGCTFCPSEKVEVRFYKGPPPDFDSED